MGNKYILELNETEFMLVGRLISHVKLGANTEFSSAAHDICLKMENLDNELLTASYDKVAMKVVVEGIYNSRAIEINVDDVVIEV
jgi:hypothetical protein